MKTLQELGSPERIQQTQNEYSDIAKEPVTIEFRDNDIFVYGSELACLRLYYKFHTPNLNGTHVRYSENLKTWYFVKYK